MFSDCKQDVDLSNKKFLDEITKLLDINAPVKKLSHKEKKVLSKPLVDQRHTTIHKAEKCFIQKIF